MRFDLYNRTHKQLLDKVTEAVFDSKSESNATGHGYDFEGLVNDVASRLNIQLNTIQDYNSLANYVHDAKPIVKERMKKANANGGQISLPIATMKYEYAPPKPTRKAKPKPRTNQQVTFTFTD